MASYWLLDDRRGLPASERVHQTPLEVDEHVRGGRDDGLRLDARRVRVVKLVPRGSGGDGVRAEAAAGGVSGRVRARAEATTLGGGRGRAKARAAAHQLPLSELRAKAV